MFPDGVAITSDGGSPTVTFIRTPQVSAGGYTKFPGLSLTVDASTVLMDKAQNNQVDDYPALILNGGVVCKALGSISTAVITGAVKVVHQSYLSSGTDKTVSAVLPPPVKYSTLLLRFQGSAICS